jgi:ArsR family transcriptional regulator, nickel/cobalt-responsive transcriptional repressor
MDLLLNLRSIELRLAWPDREGRLSKPVNEGVVTPAKVDHLTCAKIMKVLADDTRFSVMQHLLERPQHVYELNAALRIDPTLLSHHLRVLRQAGLVVSERQGKSLLYRIALSVRSAPKFRALDFGCCRLHFSQPNRKI